MKLAPQQKTEMMAGGPEMSQEEYPYGLCIRLDEDTITKLGIDGLPNAGDAMTVTAKAVVKSVSLNEYENEGARRTIELQITDMAVGPADKPKKSAADILYGDDYL